jgi:hypothetical protein
VYPSDMVVSGLGDERGNLANVVVAVESVVSLVVTSAVRLKGTGEGGRG